MVPVVGANGCQKIELVDDTGFTRHPFTSKDADIAGVKSVISKVQIPMVSCSPASSIHGLTLFSSTK